MSVDQAAIAETALAGPPVRRGGARLLGTVTVCLALLSALITFVVLADLTPVPPTHYVVVTLLLANALAVVLLIAIILREVWQVLQARREGKSIEQMKAEITMPAYRDWLNYEAWLPLRTPDLPGSARTPAVSWASSTTASV